MVRFILGSIFALACVSALVAVPTASAQTAGDETNLIQSLQELGYRYKVESDGWTMVEVPTEEGGMTRVYISPLQNIEGKRVHVVQMVLGTIEGNVSEKFMNVLRTVAGDLPFGYLRLVKTTDGSKHVLLVEVKVNMEGSFMAKGLANLLRECAKLQRIADKSLTSRLAA